MLSTGVYVVKGGKFGSSSNWNSCKKIKQAIYLGSSKNTPKSSFQTPLPKVAA